MSEMEQSEPATTSTDSEVVAPPSALRTYMMLRLAMVAVIAALFVSILLEFRRVDCVQPSISAYYYTPVRAMFVGALVTLGTAMIVLWGKNIWEDMFLNLAGLVATVVAFVPTSEPSYCLKNLNERVESKDLTPEQAQRITQKLVNASERAIDNNVRTLGVILVLALVCLAMIALKKGARLVREPETKERRWFKEPGFYLPWGAATTLLVVFSVWYKTDPGGFYDSAHDKAAKALFVFIVLVVATNAVTQWRAARRGNGGKEEHHGWYAVGYGVLTVVMLVGGLVVALSGENWSIRFVRYHYTFVAEGWLIGWFAVFWIVQTIDRRKDSAPRGPKPRTLREAIR